MPIEDSYRSGERIERGKRLLTEIQKSATTITMLTNDHISPLFVAAMVAVSAGRENGELLGYRIAPGKEQEQFALLGFQPGDLVTGVNGIALNDPANTLRLYQTMRSAGEAVFDLQRGGEAVTVSVSLGEDAQPDGQAMTE